MSRGPWSFVFPNRSIIKKSRVDICFLRDLSYSSSSFTSVIFSLDFLNILLSYLRAAWTSFWITSSITMMSFFPKWSNNESTKSFNIFGISFPFDIFTISFFSSILMILITTYISFSRKTFTFDFRIFVFKNTLKLGTVSLLSENISYTPHIVLVGITANNILSI